MRYDFPTRLKQASAHECLEVTEESRPPHIKVRKICNRPCLLRCFKKQVDDSLLALSQVACSSLGNVAIHVAP